MSSFFLFFNSSSFLVTGVFLQISSVLPVIRANNVLCTKVLTHLYVAKPLPIEPTSLSHKKRTFRISCRKPYFHLKQFLPFFNKTSQSLVIYVSIFLGDRMCCSNLSNTFYFHIIRYVFSSLIVSP